jgi:hypothetical protein
MSSDQWLLQQQQLYQEPLPTNSPHQSIHPVSGVWQESDYLQSVYWWGGGTTQETEAQIPTPSLNSCLGVLTFGPVQAFLGGGQRLRDWAVGSWLCHYLACAVIYRWQSQGGHILLPLQVSCPLLQWMKQETVSNPEDFWKAELPNVFTGTFPEPENWLDNLKQQVTQEWSRFVLALEQEVVRIAPHLLNGQGWKVIHRDHAHLWTVYTAACPLDIETASRDADRLHRQISTQKLGRSWEGVWWGGKTSPTAGSHSVWHPGLKSVAAGGTWGIDSNILETWWENASQNSPVAGLFSSGDRLNSIELVKRLASIPNVIEPTLNKLWGSSVPSPCPWERFPDRSAIAASWVPKQVSPEQWNNSDLEALASEIFPNKEFIDWGMPHLDSISIRYLHPRILERRNIKPEGRSLSADENEALEIWDELMPSGWESPIEWTVGWRGDGDHMGDWFSGTQYSQKNLSWLKWHPDAQRITENSLGINPPHLTPAQHRKLDIPHSLDLSVLFNYWNRLLYRLVEEHHEGRVIFAGGDDFLLLGPITQTVPLTSALDSLWRGETTAITTPLNPEARGWTNYQGETYPVPGPDMSFSLGVVIAQRRIPQSRWHRGLNASYKAAKNQGRNRVCVQVLFNSGQTLQWICPWPLWRLLMNIVPAIDSKTELNRWEKLLSYIQGNRLVETSRLQQIQNGSARMDSQTAPLLEALWKSVGLPLTWADLQAIAGRDYNADIYDWGWWQNWVALRSFLARQRRERDQWLERVRGS